MKRLMDRIDRFCLLHPRFGIRRLMLYIVIGNIIVFALRMMDGSGLIYPLLRFSGQGILHGEIWRIATYLIVPASTSPLWLLIELYVAYWIGTALEHEWGAGKFTIYYVIGALFQALFGVVLSLVTKTDVVVFATYLNLSLFFAFATLYPDMQVLLMFILPVKMKWAAFVSLAFFVYEIITTPFPMALVPIGAVLNYLIFFGGRLLDYIRPSRVRAGRKTVQFHSEAKRIRKEQEQRGYRHKCEVCGRTDADYPDLQFRYCSRCAGYHCFCEDHISNHTHFT